MLVLLRRKVALMNATIVGGICMLSTVVGLAQTAPTKVVERKVDYVVPISQTVDERLGEVDAALRVRIANAGEVRPFAESVDDTIRRRRREVQPLALTYYQAEVLEVVKPHPLARVGGVVIPLILVGGAVTVDGTQFVTLTDVPRLNPGEYLLFVKYDKDYGGMVIEPFDIFRLDAKTVESNRFGRMTEYGKSLLGRESTDALGAIRAAADRLAIGVPR